ncbi:hypothetical protein AVEN_73717-1 [Araneus ventricosus]|uniref:Uncharacterized protein n=1 Tax=Araneus ventricosus TaxID=182803 RepID=A0A4Y2HQP9_ARAVE|nr:hypothetical protein AVEN_73717-1 [Araneus ventricosus]
MWKHLKYEKNGSWPLAKIMSCLLQGAGHGVPNKRRLGKLGGMDIIGCHFKFQVEGHNASDNLQKTCWGSAKGSRYVEQEWPLNCVQDVCESLGDVSAPGQHFRGKFVLCHGLL